MYAHHWKYQQSSQDLACVIKDEIQADQYRQAYEAGSVVESLLASNLTLIREAWIQMWG